MAFCTSDISLDLLSTTQAIVLASAVGLFYLVLVRYASTILNVERSEETFKMELKSLIAGVALAILISAFVVPLLAFINSLNAPSLVNPTLLGIKEAVTTMASFGAVAYDLAPFSASFSVSFLVKAGYTSSGALGVLADTASRLSSISANLTSFWGYIKISYNLICFLMDFAATYLLLGGFVLRMLPPFKRVGSTLISISLGLLIALPLSFYFSNELANSLLDETGALNTLKTNINLAFSKVSGLVSALKAYQVTFLSTSLLGALLSNPSTTGLPPPLPYAATASAKMLQFRFLLPINIFAELLLSQQFVNIMVSAIKAAADFTILIGIRTVLTSFLIVFSTLGFIRSIALILGGEFFLYGIQRRV